MRLKAFLKGAGIATALVAGLTGALLYGRAALSALFPATISSVVVPLAEFEHLERYGSVEAIMSDKPPRGLVLLAAPKDDAHASRADAEAFARTGLIAVLIDLDALRSELARTPADEDCHYVTDDLKDIGQAVHRALGITRYFFPVITGRGEGAAFAYAALAQAPDNTLAGAVTVGFHPDLASDRPYCFEPRLETTGADRLVLRPEPVLPAPWHVIAEPGDAARIESFQNAMPAADVIVAGDEDAARRALVDSVLRLGQRGDRDASDLPVTVIRPEGTAAALAIIVSGDGGWRDIDKTIGDVLAKQGVAVVGLDSLRYFWSRKSPAQVAADIALLVEHYEAEFGAPRLALVGFSFGADIMPEVWPLLPKSVRSRIQVVSLLGLGLQSDFEVTVAGFAGAATNDSRALAPVLQQLPLERTQCIFGKEDAEAGETSCTAPELGSAERIPLEGGHHFDGEYEQVATLILRRLMGASPAPAL